MIVVKRSSGLCGLSERGFQSLRDRSRNLLHRRWFGDDGGLKK
jgi:hypothetical protein